MKNILSIVFIFASFLPSFGQKIKKDSVQNQIVAYKNYYDHSGQYRISIDTTLLHFEISNGAFRDFALNTFVGNMGTAVLPILQQDDAGGYDLLFDKYIRYNFYKPEDVVMYQTRSPFTQLTYFSSGTKSRQEQNFKFIHTQNVNRYLNVGFFGNLLYSDGQFDNQLIKGNSFCLFSSYNGKRYSFNFDAHLSKLKTEENGGMYSDSTYEHSNVAEYTLPVNLESASSVNRTFNIFFQHRLYLTGSYKEDTLKKTSRWNDVLSIIHRVQYEKSYRSYTDDLTASPISGVYDRDYYKNIYIDSTSTLDSTTFRRFENNFLLALNAQPLFKIPAELRVGIKNQLDKVGYSTPVDSTINMKSRLSNYYVNSALVGSLTNRFSKTITWGASGELYFTGYKAGNIYLSGDISKTIKNTFQMTLKGDFSLEKVPYFLQDFESNHFLWHNAYTAKQSNTIVKAILFHLKYKIWLEGEIGSYIHFIYFNSIAEPSMADVPFTMMRVSGKKYFDGKILHTMFRLTAQKSANENAMPLPLFSGFNTSYLELVLFKKVLQLQLGWDMYYNTAYYAKAYMPATGVFYSQSDIKIGNVPYGDVFLNIKIKRARLSFRYENVTSLLTNSGNYFAPHYPFNPSALRIGISWNFYD